MFLLAVSHPHTARLRHNPVGPHRCGSEVLYGSSGGLESFPLGLTKILRSREANWGVLWACLRCGRPRISSTIFATHGPGPRLRQDSLTIISPSLTSAHCRRPFKTRGARREESNLTSSKAKILLEKLEDASKPEDSVPLSLATAGIDDLRQALKL